MSPEADDNELVEYALARQWIIITCNRDDFLDLCRDPPHTGLIILIRRRTRIAKCAAILRLIDKAGREGLRGNINFA